MRLRINNVSRLWWTALAVGLVFLVAACTSDTSPSDASRSDSGAPHVSAPIQVVATSNIVADWATQVGGDRVTVFSLLPVSADPHSFQPGARDVTKVAEADLVLSVGLGLEDGWLSKLVRNAAADESKVVALGKMVAPLEVGSVEGVARGRLDPHFWLDPLRVKRAVSEIAGRLSAVDTDGAEVYRSNARAYGQELDELHAWTLEQVATISPKRRLLVTSHDSLTYFAKLYGFDIVGTVVPGVTTEVEPSAEELARLVRHVRENDIQAIFTETTLNDRLARTIAQETGAAVVNGLHTGSLGEPTGSAGSYIGMIRTNVREIINVLR